MGCRGLTIQQWRPETLVYICVKNPVLQHLFCFLVFISWFSHGRQLTFKSSCVNLIFLLWLDSVLSCHKHKIVTSSFTSFSSQIILNSWIFHVEHFFQPGISLDILIFNSKSLLSTALIHKHWMFRRKLYCPRSVFLTSRHE